MTIFLCNNLELYSISFFLFWLTKHSKYYFNYKRKKHFGFISKTFQRAKHYSKIKIFWIPKDIIKLFYMEEVPFRKVKVVSLTFSLHPHTVFPTHGGIFIISLLKSTFYAINHFFFIRKNMPFSKEIWNKNLNIISVLSKVLNT